MSWRGKGKGGSNHTVSHPRRVIRLSLRMDWIISNKRIYPASGWIVYYSPKNIISVPLSILKMQNLLNSIKTLKTGSKNHLGLPATNSTPLAMTPKPSPKPPQIWPKPPYNKAKAIPSSFMAPSAPAKNKYSHPYSKRWKIGCWKRLMNINKVNKRNKG